jgi:2-dehydro-3-deoxyphosphooctonate aldolase (KDO 8-P synthase)
MLRLPVGAAKDYERKARGNRFTMNASDRRLRPNAEVNVGPVTFGNDLPLVLIAGPCQLESRDHAFAIAAALKEMTGKAGIGLVFKTSFDKANRTSLAGKRGVGLARALEIFAELRSKFSLPVLTDVHEREQCAEIAKAVDVLQIPAFLSRQTDLLVAAAATGKPVNVKKGFLAPWVRRTCPTRSPPAAIRMCLDRARASLATTLLVSDMRALPIMARWARR